MDRTNTIGWTGRAVCAGAALLMAVGAAAAQQGGFGPPGRERGQQPSERAAPPGRMMGQGGMRAMRDQPVFLRSEGGENEVVVRLHRGQAAAKIDGELVPPEQVQVRGNRIYVLDDFGEVAAVFRVPAALLRQPMADQGGWDSFFEEEDGQAFNQPARPQPRRPMAGQQGTRFFIPEPWAEHAWLLEPPKVVLGILMEPAPADELREHEQYTRGVLVERVHEGLAAADAGVRPGDIIVELDGEPNVSAERIRQFIREANPGDTAELTIIRDGEERTIEVELKAYEPREVNWDYVATGPFDDQQDDWRPRQSPRQEGERPRPGGAAGGGQPPRLGVSVSQAPEEMFEDVEGHDEGVLVQSVQDNLPASKAGLKEGDVIVEFNRQKVSTPEELQRRVNQARRGQTVRLTIIRDGETQHLSVNFSE